MQDNKMQDNEMDDNKIQDNTIQDNTMQGGFESVRKMGNDLEKPGKFLLHSENGI